MDAKEKALELVNKFHQHAKGQTDEVRWIHAKLCAIIAVDEQIEMDVPGYPSQGEYDDHIMVLQQIRQEIEKL